MLGIAGRQNALGRFLLHSFDSLSRLRNGLHCWPTVFSELEFQRKLNSSVVFAILLFIVCSISY